MQIIKKNISFIGEDASIKITINNQDNFLGAQQEINNLTGNVSNDVINPAIDFEKWKFKYNTNLFSDISFYFSSIPDNSFGLTGAGFTDGEISNISNSFANSFFILDFYDSYDPNTQTKIFTTYLSKLGDIPRYFIGLDSSNGEYVNNQFTYLYVPQWYISRFTGTTAIGYIKFSFYNSKLGRTSLFYNVDNESLNTSEKIYFKTELNLINKNWTFMDLTNGEAQANEVTLSTAYINRLNNTVDKQSNISQTYPEGIIFNYETGKYI